MFFLILYYGVCLSQIHIPAILWLTSIEKNTQCLNTIFSLCSVFTAGLFAGARSSLLVTHNFDQTIEIIYKSPANKERIPTVRREEFLFVFPVSVTLSEKFTLSAVSADVKLGHRPVGWDSSSV